MLPAYMAGKQNEEFYMFKTDRIICLVSVVVLLPILALSCGKNDVKQPSSNDSYPFANYRDIPGVTNEEIAAIEALKKERSFFVYGMTNTTEAFVDTLSSNEEIKGYSALFCDWMTALFGIPFKPTLYNWGDLFAGLASGEIDFTGDLMATDERQKIYFMTDPIAQRSLKTFQISGMPTIHEIAQSRPPRFAFLGASAVLDKVSDVTEYDFETIFVDDFISAYHLMKNGGADAFLVMGISEASFDEFGDVTAETFLPLVYNSASMSTQNPKLEPVISVVEKVLRYNETHRYLFALSEEGYKEYCKHKMLMHLTSEERAYIKNNPVVRVGMDPGNYPASFYDKREKEWRGIFLDLLGEVTDLTGLVFERVNDENTGWPVIYQMLVDGDISIVPELTQSKDREGKFLWPQTVQMTDYYALLSKTDCPNIKINEILHFKVGIAKNIAYSAIFKRWFPDHVNTVEYESMEEAFNALQRGEVDMVMANQKRLLYLTHYLELTGYKTNIVFDQPLDTKFGINKDEEILCSIIDKALKTIDTKGISDQWMKRTYDYQRKLAEARFPFLMGVVILTLFVLVFVSAFFVRSRLIGKNLENLVRERTHDLDLQTSMLKTVFNSSPDLIFCKDLDGCYTRCNKSMEAFLGLRQKDIIGKNDTELYDPLLQTAEGHANVDDEVVKNKRNIVFVETMVSKAEGGKKIIIESNIAPLIQDGEVIGIMGVCRDITERKETENKLALQTAKLQAIFDSIPDILFCKDLNYKFTQINKVADEYNSVQKTDLIGKDEIAMGFNPELMKKIMEDERTVINEDRKIVLEERIPYMDGTTRTLETIKAPLKQDGVIVGLIAIAHDITERKEMEEAALLASRSKSAFLANMSHEIRTPMNSIMGFTELAMDSEASVKTKDYLDKIMMNATWLLQIINDILDISKIESGKMELENIPFDMHELFASCRMLIMPKAVEKGLLLHFYAEPSFGKKPLGDPTRLRQVLVNLLSNAVKFTNTGMIKLQSAIKEKKEKSITMSFAIIDSGIGMTGEQISRVFDPFMQADDTTTRKFGGTGLGLSITKNIVELMGGMLVVESTPKVGSKFSFDLTFDTIDVSDDDHLGEKIVFDTLKRPAFDGEVLLCEDSVMNQQMICEHLARVGLKTIVAENGKIGVDMVASRLEKGEKQFDLIFMDMHMPVMDGLEAASKIFELNTKIPIVALTANVMTNDIEIYKKSGMNDCVGKPFTSQELWRCLMKYFKPLGWQTMNETQNAFAEKDLRQKLVINFVKSNRNRISEIKDAVSHGNMELAHRLAHTMKGNAAQLGKILLQKAAAEIEQQLKDGSPPNQQQMTTLETELSAVLAELTPQLEQFSHSGEAVAAESHDPETIRDLFEKLEPLLEGGDPECLKLIDSLRQIPGSDNLMEQMENLDFDAAMKTFIELKEKGIK